MGHDRRKARARRAAAVSHSAASRFRLARGFQPRFESLEQRQMMTIDLSLAGAETLLGGTNISASGDFSTQQQNMQIDVNPVNPLFVTGVSERNTPGSGVSLGLYRSSNGGTSFTTTLIDNSVDAKGAGAVRSDPSLAYGADGKLYVSYTTNDGVVTSIVVVESDDNGATLAHVVTVDAIPNALGTLRGSNLGTGPDGLMGQAVYVAYDGNDFLGARLVRVAGSNNGGSSFTSPLTVTNTDHSFSRADASVGPNGELYVSWFDNTDNAIRMDRDLDGRFVAVNSFGADITVVDNATARPTLPGNFNLVLNHIVPAAPGISVNPELDVDKSNRPTSGILYISFMDLLGGIDSDIYVARSLNQGADWTINPAITTVATEFLPSLDVDQTSGTVNLIHYTTAGDPGDDDDVNVSILTSINGGQSFTAAQNLSTATSRADAIAGNNDFKDHIGLAVHDGTFHGLWADNRGPSLQVQAFTASASFSSSTDGNVLTVVGDEAGATDDTIIIRRSMANEDFVEVVLNGELQYAGLLATLDRIIVNSLLGTDSLTIDNSNGVVNVRIDYDGGTSMTDNDKLAIIGNPGVQIARETFLAAATKGFGTWVLDPDGNRGAGLNGLGNGDELTVFFSNLEPVDSDVPVVAFDAILTAMADNATVQNGGLLNTFDSLQVLDNGATFETFRFARKTNVRIMGQSAVDTIAVNYTTAATGLATLEIDGNVATGILLPIDDNAADVLSVLSNAAGITHTLAGQGGDDLFTVGNGDVTLILSPVAIVGGDGIDSLVVNDSVRVVAADYYVDPTTIAICTSPGPPPVRANIATFDDTLETARLNGTQEINRFDVTPSTTLEFTIDGNLPNTIPGDLLSTRFAGTTGAAFVNVAGTGMWTFTNRMAVKFEEIERFNFLPIVAYSAEASNKGKPTVKVVDGTTGTLISSFLAYESGYKEGVRIAVGDVTGDGIPEIITVPGRNRVAQVRIFDAMTGTQIAGYSFNAYSTSFKNGAMVAVGDVNGDGLNDIVVGPSRGKAEIRTFLNQFATNPTTPFSNAAANRNEFLAFKSNFVGGVTVAVGDVLGDARAEIIVGTGAGIRDEVRIFDGLQNGSTTSPVAFLRKFQPFEAGHRGGVSVAVANLDADVQLEIVVGTAVGGQSRVATYDTVNLAAPTQTFLAVFTGSGSNAPVRVAAVDANFDGLSDIYAAQGFDGKSQRIRRAAPLGAFVDFLLENSVEFRNGFYVAGDVNGIPPFLC